MTMVKTHTKTRRNDLRGFELMFVQRRGAEIAEPAWLGSAITIWAGRPHTR